MYRKLTRSGGDFCDLEAERLRRDKDVYTVGRSATCDVIVQQEMTSVKVDNSWLHCGLTRAKQSTSTNHYLGDYHSNGTFVNGVRIGKGKKQLLAHGDEISMAYPKEKVFTYLGTTHCNPAFSNDINKDFVIVRLLGKGSYREVWLSVNQTTNGKYAIKKLDDHQIVLAGTKEKMTW